MTRKLTFGEKVTFLTHRILELSSHIRRLSRERGQLISERATLEDQRREEKREASGHDNL